jgi:SAM-dependent methyltransferase
MKCYLCGSTKVKEKKIGKYVLNCCQICSMQFVKDFGNEVEFHKKYFEKFRLPASKKNELREQQYHLDAQHFHNWVHKGSVIDIGCSNGRFIEILNDYKVYHHFTGLDIDYSAIENAKNKQGNAPVDFINSSLVNYKTEHEYDAAVFRGTLQYMSSDLKKTMLKLKKIIKKGGLIIVYSLPNADSFIFKLVGKDWSLFNPQEHKLFFNHNSLEYLAGKFNFTILEISYPYINTPYENIEQDYRSVIDIIKRNKKNSPPFFGNIIQLVLRND